MKKLLGLTEKKQHKMVDRVGEIITERMEGKDVKSEDIMEQIFHEIKPQTFEEAYVLGCITVVAIDTIHKQIKQKVAIETLNQVLNIDKLAKKEGRRVD